MIIVCRTEASKNIVRKKIDAMPLPLSENDHVYMVEIKEWKPSRSDAQNRLFHAMIRQMAKEMGHSVDDMKDMAKIKLRPEWNTTAKLGDVEVFRTFETSKLNISDFAELLDDLIQWIGELGIGINVDPYLAKEAEVRF